MSYPYLIQGDNIVIVIDNETHTISRSHVAYSKVREAIKAQDWVTVAEQINPVKAVIEFGMGKVAVKGDTLYWDDEVLDNSLSKRLIQMLQDGFTVEPLVLFMENIMENPSARAVNELYGFLERNNLPITPDGHFLAFKMVRQDYTDCHRGTMDNSVGQVLSMPRNKVDDEKTKTCSYGLHFCSKEYIGKVFGKDKPVMILKINPRDVVSIPTDYNFSKGRACGYEIVGELGVSAADAFDKAVMTDARTPLTKLDEPEYDDDTKGQIHEYLSDIEYFETKLNRQYTERTEKQLDLLKVALAEFLVSKAKT